VRAFTGGLEDYLSVMRANRLTIVMEMDTIEIFESLVAIFVPLLECGRRKLRCKQVLVEPKPQAPSPGFVSRS
jgi:hypothetical protein